MLGLLKCYTLFKNRGNWGKKTSQSDSFGFISKHHIENILWNLNMHKRWSWSLDSKRIGYFLASIQRQGKVFLGYFSFVFIKLLVPVTPQSFSFFLVELGTESKAFTLSYVPSSLLCFILRQSPAKLLNCPGKTTIIILLPQLPTVLGLQTWPTIPGSIILLD